MRLDIDQVILLYVVEYLVRGAMMAVRGFLAALGKTVCRPRFIAICSEAQINDNDLKLLIGLCCEDKNVDQVIDLLPYPISEAQYRRKIKILKKQIQSWCAVNKEFFDPLVEWPHLDGFFTWT